MNWKKCEVEMPAEGQWVTVYNQLEYIFTAYFDGFEWKEPISNSQISTDHEPSHWMPLPEPPKL